MAERLIWKLGMTRDFLKSLPDEEIVNELIKMGVDEEMLGQLDHEGLIGLLDDMDDLDDEDLKDFDLKIVPMIRDQTGDSGMVMMVSSDRVIPTYAETLVDGIYPLRYLEGEIIDDGRGLTLRADDGVEYKLYAIPDDSIDFMNFVNECLPDFIPDNVNDLMASDEYLDDDMAYNEVINNLPELIDDEDVIKDYAYIPAFENNRKRIDNKLDTNESLGESMSDLEKLDSFLGIDDVDESLNEDTEEYYVLSISDRGGNSDYIKGPMTKEEATEYAKISRKNASKYYREKYLVYPKNRIPGRYKHLLDNESLQESISLDQADREKLVDEISQIKSMDRNKLYDLDLLTTDLSDGSVEELFPVTTKLIVSFLSEMANITKEELADKDQINIWWTDGDLFDDRDWEALFGGADKLINGKKRVLWKVYYSPYLDEDLNSDVYNALSDVAYDYEVNKLEPVYVDDFEEAEKNFNDKFFDGLTRDDYDESLNESLSNELQNKIKEICDVMIANLEKEDLEYIIEEPPYSEDGILSNDDLADLNGDENEIAEFAINYIKSKI